VHAQSNYKHMNIYGIMRKNDFSPNHVNNDAAIYIAVCKQLALKGINVESYSEDKFLELTAFDEQPILTMGRSKKLLVRLQELEKEGIRVINSAFAIENCFRVAMTEQLLAYGLSYPESTVLGTTEKVGNVFAQYGGPGIWIKRGDFHAVHQEDVSFARSEEEANTILAEYALRGIEQAVLSKHISGDLLKFYAVADSDFFYWFYPYDVRHHKFMGYESINGKTLHHPFDMHALRTLAQRAAHVLGVKFYGGDAIIQKDGSIVLIDLNDWPSFAPCRVEAAEAIASYLEDHFNKINNQYLSSKHG